uniref:hypothetical protein n=1 Tax=Methylobacterium sp. TaxID=409 RepID=UPI0020C851D7|nr:hypothetical protein [Methylobacterium sp.]USU34709.1 hypothetical protein NG677_24190 [Methylobacterium sp.]
MKDWIEHFRAATVGMAVAHVWRGYGSALFIEFGELTPATGRRKDGTSRAPSGEIGLMIENDWRIEDAHDIVCGSGSDEELWKPTFARLIGRHVADVTTFGRLPEVLISLSDDFHVASFSTIEGDPVWTLFDRRGPLLITVGCSSGTISNEQGESA